MRPMAPANPNWYPRIKMADFPHIFPRGWNRHISDGAIHQPWHSQEHMGSQKNTFFTRISNMPSNLTQHIGERRETHKRGRARWSKSLTSACVLFLRSAWICRHSHCRPRSRRHLLPTISATTAKSKGWRSRYSTWWVSMGCYLISWVSYLTLKSNIYRVCGQNQYQ